MSTGDSVRLQGRSISRATFESFAANVGMLIALKPWESVDPDEPLLVDIPSRGWKGLLLGVLGDEPPVLSVTCIAADFPATREGSADRRLATVYITFVRRSSMPDEFERLRAASDERVGNDDVVPLVGVLDRQQREAPFEDRHVWMLARCAGALAGLLVQSPGTLAKGPRPSFACSFFDENDVEVVVRSLDAAGQLPRDTDPVVQAVRTPSVGRNDPCPCGSGRKYKKCCA